jgi:hypothetical protein
MRIPRFQGLRGRLSYANVMATLAFFFALTGGAMATGKYLTANDPITAGDLAGSTYGTPVIASGKITSAQFASTAKSPDADTLDGIDSTQFLSGYTGGRVVRRPGRRTLRARVPGHDGERGRSGRELPR